MKKNMPYLKKSHLFLHSDGNEKFIDFLGDYKQDESWTYKIASFFKITQQSIKPASEMFIIHHMNLYILFLKNHNYKNLPNS